MIVEQEGCETTSYSPGLSRLIHRQNSSLHSLRFLSSIIFLIFCPLCFQLKRRTFTLNKLTNKNRYEKKYLLTFFDHIYVHHQRFLNKHIESPDQTCFYHIVMNFVHPQYSVLSNRHLHLQEQQF